MISGTAYGVVLNDRDEIAALGGTLQEAPYKAPPAWPVVYIKPRNCFSFAGAPIPLEPGFSQLCLAPTLAVLFGRDASHVSADTAFAHIAAACLTLDVATSRESYYRPAIAQSCRDGFLPLGAFAPLPRRPEEIVTRIDEQIAHRWSLSRLVRPAATLIAELSSYMTFRAGDVLLVGLPGDAPHAKLGQTIQVSALGLPTLTTRIEAAP